jgi:hypothetical protein
VAMAEQGPPLCSIPYGRLFLPLAMVRRIEGSQITIEPEHHRPRQTIVMKYTYAAFVEMDP